MKRKPGETWRCSACGEPLIGAQSSANPKSVMPVVLKPHPHGNVLVQNVDGVITGFVIGNALIRDQLLDLGVQMRVNHFADCPHAEQFRRPAEAGKGRSDG